MKFLAADSTEDGRITKGHVYVGNLVFLASDYDAFKVRRGLRIAVYDNKHEWMTYDPKMFKPLIGG